MAGHDLETLAADHLSDVVSEDYRTEQLSEFVASVFEHHVPWTLGIVLGWVNERMSESGVALTSELPGYVHYGVPTEGALKLMLAGVRSRRLAVRVARSFEASNTSLSLNEWLDLTGIPAWRTAFEASPTELADLLSVLRSPTANIVASVVDGDPVSVPLIPSTTETPMRERPVTIAEAEDEPEPRTLLVLSEDGSPLGRVAHESHEHVRQVLELGLALEVTLTAESTLVIRQIERPEPDDVQAS